MLIVLLRAISNHGLAKLIFERYSHIQMLRVVKTRFDLKIAMVTRLQEVKFAFEKMVMIQIGKFLK